MLKDPVRGKRILFIGVKFYHYNDEIISKLKARGAEVVFFYERDITLKHAFIDSFLPDQMDKWQAQHYNGILTSISGQTFDYLLVIRGYKMPIGFESAVRSMNPNIRSILYQWDSLNNWNYLDAMGSFDRVYTFDYKDAEDLNIKYIPTFHTDEFAVLKPVKIKYDLFFFGNYTLERYQEMQKIIDFSVENGYRLKTHLFLSFKRYLRERIKGAKIDRKYVAFTRMNKYNYLQLFNESNIIVDITTETQSGLAMRVLDALGAGKKLITNNKHISAEPFYNPKQIYIVDPANFEIPASFFEEETFDKINYSIDTWIDRIFAD